MSVPTTLEALQLTLAGEHAAIWVYGLVGGQSARLGDAGLQGRIEQGYDAHVGRRDRLAGMVRDLGVEPVPSEVAYEVDGPTGTATQLSAVARRVEHRMTAVYADLVAAAAGAQRAWAIAALSDAAVREVGFGGRPSTYPGMGELDPE